jgi:hypothetical protein
MRCTKSPETLGGLCKSLICRHNLKNAGEVVWAVFFIGKCDFDSMGVDLSGRNFAKTIAKDSGKSLGTTVWPAQGRVSLLSCLPTSNIE